MKNMSKVIDKMKHSFFGGEVEDHLAADKKKPAALGWKRSITEIESVSEGVKKMELEEEKKSKQVKMEDKSISDNQVKEMIKKGTVEKQTVGWLKDVLNERGIVTKAKVKAKLLEELKEWAHRN